MVEPLTAAALAGGLSWGSGIRLYMTLFIAGLFGRMGWLDLPPSLQALQATWVLGVTGILLVVEFLADKIPGIDSAWDAIHTFIRIPAGAILGAAAIGQIDPQWTTGAAGRGGAGAAGARRAGAGSGARSGTAPE